VRKSGGVEPIYAFVQVRGQGEAEQARVAELQKGYVQREQLLAMGVGRGAIEHRLRTGRLRRTHPEVFLVAPAGGDPLGEEMAAVLHFRGYAALSHRSAGALWKVITRPQRVAVTVARRRLHAPAGLDAHYTSDFDPRDLRIRSGLPVTAPARTVIDLAADCTDGELMDAVSETMFRYRLELRELEEAMGRAPTRKGVARLRHLLAVNTSRFTESEGERRLLALLRAAELPLPVTRIVLYGYRVDFLWAAEKLIVEVDGHDFHGDRAAFDRDRRRDQVLIAHGYRVIRVPYTQLRDAPYTVIARIAPALTLAA
jgi:very-short-patch-repair endonuclease